MQNFYKQVLVCAMFFSCFGATATMAKDPWKGEEYAKNSTSQKSSAEDFIHSLNLQAASAVLDVGCGDGKITAAMAQAIPQGEVIGIDISSSMIEYAKEAFTHAPNLKFLVQDAAKVDFYQKFDLITSFTVMQWVLEQKQALKGFEKALKPGGKLCIQMPTGLPTAMEDALNKTLSSEKWKHYFTAFAPPWKFYQPKEYQDLVLDAHLSVNRIETMTKHEKFPSRAVFQGFLKQWFPYLRPLPSELKEVFLTELVDTYLEALPPNENGEVSFIVTRLEVEASK